MEKKVELASVATALARYDLPVPGGPYSKIPFHGVRLPIVINMNRYDAASQYGARSPSASSGSARIPYQ